MHWQRHVRPLLRYSCMGLLLLTGQSLAGDVPYTWIDEKGNFHMVDSLTAVPPAQRKAAQTRVDQGVLAGEEQGGTYNKMGAGTEPSAPAAAAGPEGSVVTPANAGGALPDATTRPSAATSPAARQSPSKPPSAPTVPAQDLAFWQNQLDGARAQKAALEQELQGIEAEMLRLRVQTPPGFHQQVAELENRRVAIPEQLSALERRISEEIPSAARRSGANAARLR